MFAESRYKTSIILDNLLIRTVFYMISVLAQCLAKKTTLSRTAHTYLAQFQQS